ncbi:MAG: hypothetical protein IH945_11580 [Armatimonadetes bacterium]|nr:hypothetical protein [Armatimonadota bacterium]
MITTLVVLAAQLSTSVYVEGEGYLRFVRDGRAAYAIQAELTVRNNRLVHVSGPVVSPRVQVPGTPDAIRVDLDGRVFGTYEGADRELGRLVLAVFPDDVRPVVDDGLLVSSYRPKSYSPGTNNAGVVRTGKPGATTNVAPKTTSAVQITLRESAVVETNQFTLGDIADVSAGPALKAKLEALDIARTPALGVKYRLAPSMVRSRLLRHGSEAKAYEILGATTVTVTRRGQDVTHEQFVAAAIIEARKAVGGEAPLTAAGTGPTLVAPIGELELVGGNVIMSGSTVRVAVTVYVDGKRFNGRTVLLDNTDPISMLRIGQTVKVIVRSNAATVETSGKIRSINRATGTVVVRTATGAELAGKAVGPNTVEVKI